MGAAICEDRLEIENQTIADQTIENQIKKQLYSGRMTDMAETQELIPIDQASPEELTEIIAELEQYRERLVDDTLAMAQKAKVMKAQAMASLEPQLAQIDAQLQALRQRLETLTSNQ